MHCCNFVCAVLPCLPLALESVLFESLSVLRHDGFVSLGACQVLHGLDVPLPFLPCHVDELILVGCHVPLVGLFNLFKHFVLVHPVEAAQLQPLLVPFHEDAHAKFDGFPAWLACIAV